MQPVYCHNPGRLEIKPNVPKQQIPFADTAGYRWGGEQLRQKRSGLSRGLGAQSVPWPAGFIHRDVFGDKAVTKFSKFFLRDMMGYDWDIM